MQKSQHFRSAVKSISVFRTNSARKYCLLKKVEGTKKLYVIFFKKMQARHMCSIFIVPARLDYIAFSFLDENKVIDYITV